MTRRRKRMAISCRIRTKSATKICFCYFQKKKSTLFSASLKSTLSKSLVFLSYLAKKGCRFSCHTLHCILSQSQHLLLRFVTCLLLLLTSFLEKTARQVILRSQLLRRLIVGGVTSAVFQIGNISIGIYRSLTRTVNNNDRISVSALPQLASNSTQKYINIGGVTIDYCVFVLSCVVRFIKWIFTTTYGCIHAVEDLLFDLRVLLESIVSAALKTTYSTLLSVPSLLIHYITVFLTSIIADFVVGVVNAGKYLNKTLIPLVRKTISEFADQCWSSLKNNSLDLMSDGSKKRMKISVSVTFLVVIGVWLMWMFMRRRHP